jgi:hypothetical protein
LISFFGTAKLAVSLETFTVGGIDGAIFGGKGATRTGIIGTGRIGAGKNSFFFNSSIAEFFSLS